MDEKSTGIDFDRQVFVHPQAPETRQASPVGGLLFALAIILIVAFLAYKFIPQIYREYAYSDTPGLAQLDRRLSAIELRLDKLEASSHLAAGRKMQPGDTDDSSSKPPNRAGYQVSPALGQHDYTPTGASTAADPATAQRLSSVQQGMGKIRNDQAANNEAWQAATNRLSDVVGQVGSQNVEILRSQDELNQLLSRTEMKAIPFELIKGSNPQPVGPVSLILKSANPKSQHYTLCVFISPSCIELKDRTRYEVVQFVVTRNALPFKVIATKITKDEILGYLEVPRGQN